MQPIDRRGFNTSLFFGLGAWRSRPPSRPPFGQPDLVVTAVSWSPSTPKAGDAVTFSATIENQGAAATPDGIVHGVAFRVDGATVAWSDTHTTSIPPGVSVTLAANGGPNGARTWPAVAGTHTVRAHVDDANRIPELDEANNTLDATLTVAEEPGQPDLVVTALRWSHDDGANWHTGPIPAGGDVWFEADVRNQGTGPTPAGVIVGVAFLVDGAYVAWSDTHTQAVPAGATVSLRANGGPDGDRYWNNVQAGAYTVRAHVDDVNRFPDELDKTNNTLDVPVAVEAAAEEDSTDVPWIGVNTNTGFWPNASYRSAARDHCLALGMGHIRNGIDGVGGRRVGNSFNWTTRDAVVDTFANAGIISHGLVGPQFHVDKQGSVTNWLNNFRYFCANVFAHYYNRPNRILHYSIDNEPDIASDPDYTPQFMVDATRIAWEEAKAISPDILIEGPPCVSGGAAFQQQMLNLGLTRYCDFVGIHSYGDQISDVFAAGSAMRTVWAHQLTANASHGYPIRPVIDREQGTSTAWAPSGLDGREYQKRAFLQSWMQHKRWGFSFVCLYSFHSTSGREWDIVSSQTQGQDLNIIRGPTYDAIAAGYIRRGLVNGGFEEPNNLETEWVIAYAVEQTNPFEWSKIAFVTNDPANARTGSGYCRMDMSGNAPAINGTTVKTPVYNTRVVRRVVEFLTPGQTYRITAHARIVGGSTARLKALGYRRDRGNEEQVASITGPAGWHQLQVTFTPTNPWVVVSLEGSGTGANRLIYWDDVSLVPLLNAGPAGV